MEITRTVAHISDELAEELGLILCSHCGHWFAPEQIRRIGRFDDPICTICYEPIGHELDAEEQTRKYWEWRNSR